jgi:hypothetical protein
MLGRNRDFETGKFGFKFGLGRLGDKGKGTPVLTAIRKLTIAKARLPILDEGNPASSDVDRFSSHKVYEE